MKEKLKNKKVVYTIIGIVSVLLVALAVTYAYWLVTKTQTNENVISSACLDIAISGEKNDITLSNQFPMSDEDGMKLVPYEFTVTNNCNTSVDYHVNLEATGTESSALSVTSIKAVLNDNTPRKLYDYVGADTTIDGAYEAYTLGYGTLAATGNEGSSSTYELRIWIDEDAPISEMNKTFKSKISVTIGQGISAQGDMLASLILEDAETNNYLYTTTPDFNAVTADGEYGIYSAEDDYGTSYYYRGDVENNYVKFGSITTTYEAYVPSDPSDAMFASMVFISKANCEALGAEGQLWTTCVEYTGEDLYSSGIIEAELGIQGFNSQEICENISGLTCSKTSIKKGTIIEPVYWRIIRINGDGTIRIIYDGTTMSANGVEHFATIGTTAYNTNYDNAKYVGYTYDDGTGIQVDSTIKSVVDEWYENNLESEYGKYIADNNFCNDREVTSTSGTKQYYGAYKRLYIDKVPSLKCANQSDSYTVNDIINGNGLLKNPVGLITADEIAFAGGVEGDSNSNYYLYNGDTYDWTMTPVSFSSGAAVWIVNGADVDLGNLGSSSVGNGGGEGTRPVINLKADVEFTGNGTIDNPYKIVTE